MRAALRDEPFAFIGLMSSLLSALDGDPGGVGARPMVSLAELVDSFVDVDIAETTAALSAIAALTPDEVLAQRARAELTNRRQPVPELVARLGEAEVRHAMMLSDELDDGDSVILCVRWPDGVEVTPVVYIDHNLGTIVKDAFVVRAPFAEVVDHYRELLAQASRTNALEPMQHADARAKIAAAIEAGRDYRPADEDSEWPAMRPFVAMLLRSMPAGGDPRAGRPVLPSVDPADVLAGFLASPHAAGITVPAGAHVAAAAALLIDYAAQVSGHPLRWSAVTVELALTQYLPWDASTDEATLDAVPGVLPALVSYCHAILRARPDSTAEALESVQRWRSEFDRLRALPSVVALRTATAELAALQAGDLGPWRRRMLLDELGSQEAIDTLHTRPLPDEELDLSGVPADIHDRVRAVCALTDAFAEEAGEAGSFDDVDPADGSILVPGADPGHGRAMAGEVRTACRRFVARVAANDPAIFRRRGRVETAAAAVVWVVGRANGLIGPSPAPIPSGQAQAWFGLRGSSSQRAEPMLRAIGVEPSTRYGRVGVGTPDLLTSARRGWLLRERDSGEQHGTRR